MTAPRIQTERLDLIPATVEILKSDLHDHAALAKLLDATVPAAWPPIPDRSAGLRSEPVRNRGLPAGPLPP